jgi:hypothetical protein
LDAVFSEILSVIIAKELNQTNWIECVAQISTIIQELSQNHAFSDEAIDSLKMHVNDWEINWINLIGKEWMMNYTHIIVSGQVIHFLCRY